MNKSVAVSINNEFRYNLLGGSNVGNLIAYAQESLEVDLNCFHYVTHSIVLVRERLLAMPKGSWIFLDLDDTVFLPIKSELRTVNKVRLTEHLESLKSEYPNIRELIWGLFDECENKLVEKEVIALIEELKENGIHVLGLTKRRTGFATSYQRERGLSHQDLTLMQLNGLGVGLSNIFPEGEVVLHEVRPRDPKVPLGIFSFEFQGPAIFKDGVAFTSHMDKGIIAGILIEIAQELGIPLPPQVALLDDMSDNLDDMRRALDNKIPFLSVHYQGGAHLVDNEHVDFSNITYQIHSLNEKSHSPVLV